MRETRKQQQLRGGKPIPATGADQSVRAMIAGNAAGAKGLDQTARFIGQQLNGGADE